MPPARDADSELDLELRAIPASVAQARQAVRRFARRVGGPEEEVALAVSEAVTNALVHGFRSKQPGKIRVLCAARAERLTVTVVDDGEGIRPEIGHAGLGLGLALIARLATDVTFSSDDAGTTASMSFGLVPANRRSRTGSRAAGAA